MVFISIDCEAEEFLCVIKDQKTLLELTYISHLEIQHDINRISNSTSMSLPLTYIFKPMMSGRFSTSSSGYPYLTLNQYI